MYFLLKILYLDMKVVIALLLCLLLRCTSETVVHANSTAGNHIADMRKQMYQKRIEALKMPFFVLVILIVRHL